MQQYRIFLRFSTCSARLLVFCARNWIDLGLFGEMNMSKTIIRTAKEEDAERLLEIYAPYVTDTAITFEYEVPKVEPVRFHS